MPGLSSEPEGDTQISAAWIELSEAIGLGACAITYDQAKVDSILGVDGKDEFAIYVAPVGKVTSATYHFDH